MSKDILVSCSLTLTFFTAEFSLPSLDSQKNGSLLKPGLGVRSLNLTDLWCFMIHLSLARVKTDWTPPSGLRQLLLSYSLAFSRRLWLSLLLPSEVAVRRKGGWGGPGSPPEDSECRGWDKTERRQCCWTGPGDTFLAISS